jgi:hypothetical protein
VPNRVRDQLLLWPASHQLASEQVSAMPNRSIVLNLSAFILPSDVSRPNTLLQKSPCECSVGSLLHSLLPHSCPLLNMTEHLSKLIICPVPLQYLCRVSFMYLACNSSALKNNKLSSAKRRCETSGALRHTFRPCIVPALLPCCKIHDKPSATKRNKYGDRGSPWRRPRVGWIVFKRTPLKRSVYRTVVTHSMIHCIHVR